MKPDDETLKSGMVVAKEDPYKSTTVRGAGRLMVPSEMGFTPIPPESEPIKPPPKPFPSTLQEWQRQNPGMVTKPSQTESVLKKHSNVPFVDRMLNAHKYPSRPNYDEKGTLVSRSTHLMSRAGGGPGEPIFVYPTLQLIGGKWVENEDPNSALKRGNVIYFDTAEEADRFAEGSWKPFAGKTRDDK